MECLKIMNKGWIKSEVNVPVWETSVCAGLKYEKVHTHTDMCTLVIKILYFVFFFSFGSFVSILELCFVISVIPGIFVKNLENRII